MSEQPILIGYCLSLSGPLASNGNTARLAHQIVKGADLSEFKDASTQAVVWPSSIASGTLIYPYAKAKRNG